MTLASPPEYVLARSVLLDALQGLGPHVDALVLVGAQAVYLHTGGAELIVVPTTTDADLALEALSGGSSRRSARLPVHGDRAARRTTGLEAALVDNELHDIAALDPTDLRTARLRIAGPAALLIAKVIKIDERRGSPQRHQPKDGLDVLRLLQGTPTEMMAQRLVDLLDDSLAGAVTTAAMAALRRDGSHPRGLIATLAAAGVADLADPDTISGSVAVLIEELLDAVDDLG